MWRMRVLGVVLVAVALPATARDELADSRIQMALLWGKVNDSRERFYEKTFGALPDEILTLDHLAKDFSGGGVLRFQSAKLNDLWVYSTFGLTNPDAAHAQHAPPRAAEAGHGYELVILARESADWPLWLLQWVTLAEVTDGMRLRERVERYQGLTIENLDIGRGRPVSLLVAEARAPLPAGVGLPNGSMKLLIGTVITDAEVRYALEHGRAALLERLVQHGVGQVSELGRAAVIP